MSVQKYMTTEYQSLNQGNAESPQSLKHFTETRHSVCDTQYIPKSDHRKIREKSVDMEYSGNPSNCH